MIFFLIDWLKASFGLKVPQVFLYTSTRMIMAALTSLLISILLGPWFIRKLYELKIGQTIRKEECPLLGELHHKKQDTPTMGGILIIFSMLVSLILWCNWHSIFTLMLLITTLGLAFLGGRDDYLKLKYKNTKGLAGRKKLLIQGIIAALIAAYFLVPNLADGLHFGNWFEPPEIKRSIAIRGEPLHVMVPVSLTDFMGRLYFPFVKEPLFIASGIGLIVIFLLIVFVIVGSSNAVNLTDGLDGLAAGCITMVAMCLALFAFVANNIDLANYLNILYIEGSSEIAVYLSAVAGACLGFLWYNGFPAQVFMGDIGSLTLGGVIGVSAVLLKREILLGLIGGIFVAEATSVILQVLSYRYRNKKRIFLCAPLHHHFEYKGWPETKVVLRFWIVALILALVGLGSLKFQ
jgi:phospho-N-acetylmuramoyl-pentapeptide-transferase